MADVGNPVNHPNVQIDHMVEYYPQKLYVVELSTKPESRLKR
jgi:hypothetical protein